MLEKRDKYPTIETFFRQEYQGLYRYVYSLTRSPDDSLEVVQEAFLRFCRLARDGEVRQNERALLFRLARNLSIDLLRRANIRESHARELQSGNLIVLHLAPVKTPEEILLEKERQQNVARALGLLNKKEQECLALRRCGLSYQEVAEILNMNPQSVGQTIARALRKFRGIYNEIFGDEILEKKAASGKARSTR